MIPAGRRPTRPAGPSLAELTDQLATARAVAAAARREAVDAEQRAREAEERAAAAVAERDVVLASVERAAVDEALDGLADMLVVLARWGANVDEGHPAAVLEVALRDAVRQGARAARAGDGLRALGAA